jgi:hypothetical protein
MRPDEDVQHEHVVAGDVKRCMLRARMSDQRIEQQKAASRDANGGTNERR